MPKKVLVIGASGFQGGPEALTLPQVAEQMSQAIGRRVQFRQISGDEYAGLLEPYLGSETEQLLGVHFSSVYEWAKQRTWEVQ